jgi:hypothetical protein
MRVLLRIPDSLSPEEAFDNSINDIFQQKAAMSLGLPEYRIFPNNCTVFVDFLKQNTIDSLGQRFGTQLNNKWMGHNFTYREGYVHPSDQVRNVQSIKLRFRGKDIELLFFFSLLQEGGREKWELHIHVYEPRGFDEKLFNECVDDIFQKKADIDKVRADYNPEYHIYPVRCYFFVEFFKYNTIEFLGQRFGMTLNNKWTGHNFTYRDGHVRKSGQFDNVQSIKLRFSGIDVGLIFIFTNVSENCELRIQVSRLKIGGCNWCVWCPFVFAPIPPAYY